MASSDIRLASVSVDLDTLRQYHRIHGLDVSSLDARERHVVYQQALSRFQDVFTSLGVPATYFAIGEDAEDAVCAQALKAAHDTGMEIASHSHRHAYDLSRHSQADISNDLREAHEALTSAVGVAPVGFRAPGYTLSQALVHAIAERGYRYDSSVFPATPYYLAKAAVLAGMYLQGRTSRSILDSPQVLLAPTRPYFMQPEAPYRAAEQGVLEMPMTLGQVTRFPFIGTFALTLPRGVVRALYLTSRQVSHFNFELHGVDLLDENDGMEPALLERQRDLTVSAELKQERLRTILSWLKADFDVVTLSTAAMSFQRK